MYQQSCGQVNVIHSRHPTILVFAVRTFSNSCSLVLWDLVDKFWPPRAGNMILRARKTQHFAQTDEAGTRNARIQIGMSMQRPLPPPTQARNKKPLRSFTRHQFAWWSHLRPHTRGCTDHHGSCTKFGRFEMSVRSKFAAPANVDTVVKRRRSTSDETKTNILGDEQISKVLIIRSASQNRLTWESHVRFTRRPSPSVEK